MPEEINKISAFVVAYHEEKLIERCLKSLEGVVDEIILIHDGPCSDSTLYIGRRYTDKVFEMPINKGIGESHYIFAFKQCIYNWVLRLDADEYLSEELRNNLSNLVQNKDVSAYFFVWQIWDGTRYLTKGWPHKIFLFQKEKIGFFDKYHYPIIVKGLSKYERFVVHHKPLYNNYTKEVFNKKILKWCKLQAHDHLVPVEKREIYGLDETLLKQEQARKTRFYNYPIVCGILSALSVSVALIKRPSLLFQKGFWLQCVMSYRYTYNVAREVCLLKRNGDVVN